MMFRLGSRFLLPSVCNKINDGKFDDNTTNRENHLQVIDIGFRTSSFVKKNLSKEEQHSLFLEAKMFYLKAFDGLAKSLGFFNPEVRLFWRRMTVFHPESRKFKSEKDMNAKIESVLKVAVKLPNVMPPEGLQPLVDEWKKMAADRCVEESWGFIKKGEEIVVERLDSYWNKIFDLDKYALITRFVRAVLCIQPHNAAVERGFSVNSATFTKERSRMSPELLNSIRVIKSHLRNIGGISQFRVDQRLLQLAREAHRKYKEGMSIAEHHEHHDVHDSDDEPVPKLSRKM